MKLLLEMQHRFSGGLLCFRDYFLGQNRPGLEDNQGSQIRFNDHLLVSPATLLLNEDQDDVIAIHELCCDPRDGQGLVIAVSPSIFSADTLKLPGSPCSSFILRPHYLEQIVPMIKNLLHQLRWARPVVVVLFYISHLPCKKESVSDISSSRNYDYDRAFLSLMSEIKRLVFEQKQVVVIDSANTLGQKNSALLRRMFT